MKKVLSQVNSNQIIRHTGDLEITGDVGEEAKIYVTDGSLTILGKVSDHVTLSVKKMVVQPARTGKLSFFNGAKITARSVIIGDIPLSDTNGSYFNGATLNAQSVVIGNVTQVSSAASDCSSRLDINGAVGSYVTMTIEGASKLNSIGEHGNIQCDADFIAGNIGNHTQIKVAKTIVVRDIGQNCVLTSDHGGLSADHVGSGTNIIAKKNIVVLTAAENTTLTSIEGRVEKSQAIAVKAVENNPKSITEAFNCPISLDTMKDPVFCLLDDETYERSQITAWLDEHRSSPINNAKMLNNQKVEDLLRPNKALAHAIALYQASLSEPAAKMTLKI